jgi:hypothetical protein
MTATEIQADTANHPPLVWKAYQKVAFRMAFIFFVLMTIPENPGWYTQIFQFDWTSLHYRDLYDVARFQPSLTRGGGLYGYTDWLIILGVAIAGGIVWTLLDRKRQSYNILYYWLTVIVRYRASIGIIGFAFTKVLPVQMPYPSIGILNTNFGDLTAQKIYWLSISIVPWYQVFAGIVELTAGVLLLFRKTATLGAIILFGALGDIVYVNFAYDGGVHVYSSYFVLFAAFLIAKDIPKIYNLLIRERYTVPVNFNIRFTENWLKTTRIVLKTGVIVLFLFVFFYIQLNNFLYDPYKQPAAKGVSQLRGYYHVDEFRINNRVIPYSPQDSVRWQDVTFEKWTTLSYKQNKPVLLDLSNGGGSPMRDINRTFELAGVGGGRRVFYYEADTLNHVLYLQDKNRGGAEAEGGRRRGKKKKNKQQNFLTDRQEYEQLDPAGLTGRRLKGISSERTQEGKRNRMVLNYTTTDGREVVLKGINENRDSVYVVLHRIDKKYALKPSTLSAGKY